MTTRDTQPHVMFFLPTLAGGGTERFATTMAPALAVRGWRVSFLLGEATGAFRAAVPAHIEIHTLFSPRMPLSLLPGGVVMRMRAPDLVFGLLSFGSYLGLLRTHLPRSIRLVARPSINLSQTLEEEIGGTDLWSRARRRALLFACRRLDGLVVQSDDMMRDAIRWLGPSEHTVQIANPVVAASPAVTASTVATHASPHVVAIGRLDVQKGYDLLLQAFAVFSRENPRATLTICGEGRERAALESLVDALRLRDRVSMPGFVADAVCRARAADLFVSSSRYEGLSNALLEALACGMRVLVTDCPGGNSEVVRDGENGFVCAAASSSALAEGMGRALRTTTRLTAEEIARDTLARFGIDAIAAQYDAFFRSVIARAPAENEYAPTAP